MGFTPELLLFLESSLITFNTKILQLGDPLCPSHLYAAPVT
jgi:hypothetical protein